MPDLHIILDAFLHGTAYPRYLLLDAFRHKRDVQLRKKPPLSAGIRSGGLIESDAARRPPSGHLFTGQH